MRFSRVVIASVAAVAILGGCGNSSDTASKSSSSKAPTSSSPAAPAVDIPGIQTRIVQQLSKPGAGGKGPNTQNASVTCPSNVEARAGTKFVCDVTALEGPSGPQPGAQMTGTATVTLQDDTGKKFMLDTKLTATNYSIETHGMVS
jgi:hypothetical protein